MIVILVVVAAAIYYMIVAFSRGPAEKEIISDRFHAVVDESSITPAEKARASQIREESKGTRDGGLMDELDMVFEKRSFAQNMLIEFQKADIHLRYSEYLVITASCVIIMAGVGFAMTRSPILAILISLVGLPLPRIYVMMRQRKRLSLIEGQIIDALGLISNSMKSGYSFLQAIELCSNEAPLPIRDEFKRILRETNLGRPLEDALADFGERIPTEDVRLMLTAILIQRQVGGNLSEVLDKIAYTIRERLRIKGEVDTLTAQGKMQGIILILLPFVLLFLISRIQPELTTILFTNILGQILLVISVILMTIGGTMIRKIVDIKF
jgi:tight adherence protein B